MKGFFGILAIATASLLLSACSVAHVSNFQFGASPSPEVSGPGLEMNDMGMARVSASFTAADEDEVTFPVRSHTLDETLLGINRGANLGDRVDPDSVKRKYSNEAILEIDGYHASASLEFFINFNPIFLQVGIAAYDGVYYFVAIGANHKYYDWGLFFGEFNQFTTVDYFGYWCGIEGCTEDDMADSFTATDFVVLGDVFFGAYVGAHVWRLSLNNTISMYRPGLNVDQMDYDMPYVISNYTSLGIRLSNEWTIRGGTVFSFIRNWSKPHMGLKFSLDFNIGGESPKKKEKWTPAETGAQTPAETQPVKTVEEQPATATEAEPAAEKDAPAEAETAAENESTAEAESATESEENDAEEPAEAQAEETAE